jgi:hypothetical protein
MVAAKKSLEKFLTKLVRFWKASPDCCMLEEPSRTHIKSAGGYEQLFEKGVAKETELRSDRKTKQRMRKEDPTTIFAQPFLLLVGERMKGGDGGEWLVEERLFYLYN